MKNQNHPIVRKNFVNMPLFTVAFILILSSCDFTMRFNGKEIIKSGGNDSQPGKEIRIRAVKSEDKLPLILRDSVFDVEAMRKVSLQDLLKDTLNIFEFDIADSKRRGPKFLANSLRDISANDPETKPICVIGRMTPDQALDFKREHNVSNKIYLTDASLRVPGYGRGPKYYIIYPRE
jgi:hypothetical protein